MLKFLLPLGSLIALPTLSFAKSTPVASGFYLGLGTSILTSRPISQEDAALIGPALTAGRHFTPS
jgi:hypothetical protein